MREQLRVILVDDHAMILDGLRAVVDAQDDMSVVAVAGSVQEFGRVALDSSADVVVTDWRLPDGDGAGIARSAARHDSDPAVLMISGLSAEAAAAAAIGSGCAGFLSKTFTTEELLEAIRSVHAGASVFAPELFSSHLPEDPPPVDSPLTSREAEILAGLAMARNVPGLARDLGLSVHTVRNHVRSIHSKLGATSQLEAVILGVRRGLVALE